MNEKLKLKILHCFFPNKCACCKKIISPQQIFCKACKGEFEMTKGKRCKICFALKEKCDCQRNPKFFFRSVSPFVYKNSLCNALITLKRIKHKRLAKYFAVEIHKNIEKKYKNVNFDAIIPVPLYASRRKQRGFNQSMLLAKELSDIMRVPVMEKALVQHEKAKAQHTLRYKQRKDNVKGIYRAANIPIEYQRILLVDDIMTSGATLNECAKMLRLEGVTKIYCITAAKTE